MRTSDQPACPVCTSRGDETYTDLRDRVFGAPGTWQMKRCVNARCGVYWLDPAPLADDLPIAYRGYYTHGQPDAGSKPGGFRSNVREAYLARRLGYPFRASAIERAASWLVAAMPERKHSWLYTYFYLPWIENGRLLEIGSGSGWQLARMQAAGWQSVGLDFDPAAVASARERGLDMRTGDVRDLGFAADSFDAIVMAHVLEHVFDPVGLLAECARLLKPGGRLVSITPNARSIGHRLFGPAWRGLEPPRHIAVFTSGGLRLASDRAGLAVERIEVTGRDAANLLFVSDGIRRARGDERVKLPSAGRHPPLFARLLALFERIGMLLGLPLGEELVLTAVKPARDRD